MFVLKLWRKWYYARMDRIISLSMHNVRIGQKELGLPTERFRVIPNGVNYKEIKHICTRLHKDVVEDPKTVLYYGRIAPVKGLHILLHAISHVPDAKLKIVGEGEYLPAIKKLCEKLGLGHRVQFENFLFGERLATEILRASVLVIPSLYEGQPLSLLEGMAFGKPVIVSALPSIAEIAQDGYDCIFAPPGNAIVLAEKLEVLLNDHEMRKRIGKHALQTARRLSWDNIAKKTLEVYEDALATT
jgi:glycosyltransferase involved in cell wall biosynthesis